MAAEFADDPGTRLAARLPRADVLAGGRAPVLARTAQAAADDAVARARAARRRAVARLRHAGRRPAGAVGAARAPPHRRSGDEPAGGDRRARMAHGPPDRELLSARGQAALARRRVAVLRGDGRRPAPPRPRGRGAVALVARARQRGLTRRRPAPRRRERADDAGLRGRALTNPDASFCRDASILV